jgi:NADPH-dependent glutamate synthase beta subunit-like oxidoreductase
MEQSELRQLEEQCIQDCAPACTAACPLHVDVRSMLAEIGRGDFSAALKIYRRSVPLPGVISRICDQPCQAVCRRTEIDEAIAIRALERACVEHGDLSGEKTRTPPKRRQQVVIIGGGVSGLAAAHDLARKGYKVLIVEATDRLGGSLWLSDDRDLPKSIVQHDVGAVLAPGVEVQYETPIDPVQLSDLRRQFDAVYLAIGAHMPDDFELGRDEHGMVKVDPVTFGTSLEGIFAGGGVLWGKEMRSAITSIAEGRRAGISIDRYLQKVSLTASRANEGPYVSCLYTNTAGLEARPLIEMGQPDEGYEWHEALQEAKRCIQCECMECVKVCEYLRAFERYPRKYVREIYNNLSIVKGTRYANTFINSCSLCGLCAEICPHDLDMGQVNLTARREMTAQNRMPPSAHDFALRDMAFSNSDKFQLARNAPGAATSDYVFFPGCQLSASSPEHVEQVYAYLNEHLPDRKVGLMLGCCGAPANWAGRADLFDNAIADWRENYRALGQPRVVLACSSCYQVFKVHLPDVEIVSLWELYDQLGLPEQSATPALRVGASVSLHDPCTTRYDRSIQDSARNLVQRLGYQIKELTLSREKTECCSYGGNMWQANRDLAKKVVERRVAESELDYVTYCAMCRDFFARQGKRTLHVLDLIYNQDVNERAARRGPDFSQRHENRARLKRRLLKDVWGEEMAEQADYESIKLIMADEVRERLDQRLILIEDVQRVIEYAERTGRRLLNRETGRYLAYFKPTAVTYWVEYVPQGEAFVIFNAYSHRMEVPGSVQSSHPETGIVPSHPETGTTP